MALLANPFCHCNYSQPASPSGLRSYFQDCPTSISRSINPSRWPICPHACRNSTRNVSIAHSFPGHLKESSNGASIGNVSLATFSASNSALACGLSAFSRSSPDHAWRERKRGSFGSRLRCSQGTETNTDDKHSVGEVVDENEDVDRQRLADEGATAAVTVAAISSDAEAVSNVMETVKEVEAIGGEVPAAPAAESFIGEELKAIYANCRQWQWKGTYSINYVVQGSGPPVVLVHGFGASIGHWRRNIGVLSESNSVYAIDLLGLGASAKPTKFAYTMETWAELITDFIQEIVGSSAVLVGNSIGSLACLIAAAEAPSGLVRGTVLLNCAGGMNNKAITDDWRLKLALPLLWLIDFLLNRPSIAGSLFKRVKSRKNIRNVLSSVYNNKAAVDDELLEVILTPADSPGALDAFISIITGPPGPKPQSLMPKISTPVLLIWGDKDPFTPINGPVGKYFSALPAKDPNVQLYLLPNVGHCPHDDRPELVHDKLVPWLASLPV